MSSSSASIVQASSAPGGAWPSSRAKAERRGGPAPASRRRAAARTPAGSPTRWCQSRLAGRAEPAVGEDLLAVGPEAHTRAKSVPGAAPAIHHSRSPAVAFTSGRARCHAAARQPPSRPGPRGRRRRGRDRWQVRSSGPSWPEYGGRRRTARTRAVDMLAADEHGRPDGPRARERPRHRLRRGRRRAAARAAPQRQLVGPRGLRRAAAAPAPLVPLLPPGRPGPRDDPLGCGGRVPLRLARRRPRARSPTRWASTRSTSLGFSMGGATALQFAARSPERLQTLVVIGISPRARAAGVGRPADDGPGLHPAGPALGGGAVRVATTRCRARAPGSG